jgi:hypothetical protein
MMMKLIALALVVVSAATLKFEAPAGWVAKTPSSAARLAEFTLPRVQGDAEDAALTVYFFGAGQGGNVQANIDRWIGQLAQPDGKPSKDVAKTTRLTSAAGLEITVLDVSGTYVAEVTPGSSEHFNKPGFRQLAAVVSTAGGPHFVKLIGPSATVAKWADSYVVFLKSLRYE